MLEQQGSKSQPATQMSQIMAKLDAGAQSSTAQVSVSQTTTQMSTSSGS
jgi:hypothetical protein